MIYQIICTMKTALNEIHASLVFWAFGDGSPMNTGYIGESYTNYWLFRVAEFLDSRTHKTVPFADKKKSSTSYYLNLFYSPTRQCRDQPLSQEEL